MAEPKNEKQVIQQYQHMKLEINELVMKINELEGEHHEHQLVISSIEKLEPSRKCFRLVGGVLVERTVGEVLPAVRKNSETLASSIFQLSQELEKRERELSNFVSKYKIRIKGAGDEEQQPQQPQQQSQQKKHEEAKSAAGVLV